ncbi:uncharacterized protein NEPG_01015 [Nematocida parisii ERTm1]|uniref:Uncharacterized protein n=1 Tax=Nematocida parisii (strain ERTm3) TaxID=935791 RepID=I3EJR0_NEMP3|nr:uncharacterized protein NEPG_01015 [Nematocida parisii ERTm1]EIJ89457.1 hypothetical protein NEQG_00227 [Nematocida parisii ERTm3]EIJ94347.1 hypothetical protein NEPG_01015 [Nematocida parisii ERTm1]|eukprot:XP_013058843.1 hypothetical protein NEPG_01015 [Nematocida parisii ERTm1]
MKHGDNPTITDKNGIEYSNISRLGFIYDDIYSLYLLTRAYKWSNADFVYFIKDSIYNSIYVEDNEHSLNRYIHDLYNTVYMMSICHHYISDIKLYKNENIEKIKKYLNELMSEERQIFNINNEIKKSKLYFGLFGD